jgi:hypothetical protein
MLVLTVLVRILLHLRMRTQDSRHAHAFLLPLRDLLSLGLWSWSLFTRRVQWRNSHFHVAGDGSVELVESV